MSKDVGLVMLIGEHSRCDDSAAGDLPDRRGRAVAEDFDFDGK